MLAWELLNGCILFTIIVFFNISPGKPYNVDTTSYEVLGSPKKNSYFGYSIAAARVNGNVTIWSGSPKYEEDEITNSSAKAGAIFSCSLSKSFNGSLQQNCEKLDFNQENIESKNQSSKQDDITSDPLLPEYALEKCAFNVSTCGYSSDTPNLWLLRKQYRRKNVNYLKYNIPNKQKYCHEDINVGVRLTGPPDYTVHEGMLAFNSDAALIASGRRKVAISELKSQPIAAKAGITQCLRFCFNAFSILDYNDNDEAIQNETWYTGKPRPVASKKPTRSLQVMMKYKNSGKIKKLFDYRGPKDIASKYWNFTEINMGHEIDEPFEIIFKASVVNQLVKPNCKSDPRRCPKVCSAAADIVLSDITVANSACEDEPVDVDVLEGEQSIGMSMNIQLHDENNKTLTACGSLWQQNCGYSKEATGICYEITSNTSQPRAIKNPGSTGCIRGKIDIVLLIDQSGSVNQCNFQKVKRWLRNIVRGFTIGPNDQDIGIVIYSSEEYTSATFELGFEKYGNSGTEKRWKMLEGLRKLPYEAGKTYTGLAFKFANELLWGPSARPDAKKMVILLTDGETSVEDKSQLITQVNITRSGNATILAVGVAKFNASELISISGTSQNFFPVKDFSQLEQVRDTLRQSVSYSNLEGSKGSDSMQNCQMGFSLHRNKDFLVMGSPGCYNRAGNVIKHEELKGEDIEDLQLNATTSNMWSKKNIPSNLTNNSEESEKLKTSSGFSIPTREELEEVLGGSMDDSYFGYAVTSGNFYGTSQGRYIAASAPRYARTGVVVIYKSDHPRHITKDQVLQGEQLGEYFGATLCAVDLNNDGYDDLLVGAPLYTDQTSDEGRVYVYMGAKNMSLKPDYILGGSNLPFSRFGIVITSVGDITLDMFPDIVISATYEEGYGAVYLFSGTKYGIDSKYTQRISASSFKNKPGFGLFGQSVAGGVDVDENGYPDILVGSPGSDEIVILKTRPVVKIDSTFAITTPMIDRKNDNCWRQNTTIDKYSNSACIACTVCFSFHGLSVPPGIGIHYSISPDVNVANSRVGFYGKEEDNPNLKQGSITLWKANLKNCVNHSMYLKEHIRDMMTNLTFELQFDMDEFKFNETDDIYHGSKLTPVLDFSAIKTVPAAAFFKTYCEDTSSCVADISIAQSDPVDEDGLKINEYELSIIKLLKLKLELENRGPEDAHSVIVTVEYPSSFIYSSITETQCFEYLEESNMNETFSKLFFVLSKTFISSNQNCRGMIIFLATPSVQPTTTKSISFSINASTVSKDINNNDNVKKLKIPIKYKSSFNLNGASYPPSISGFIYNSTNSSNGIFSNFQHVYSIVNTGAFAFHNVRIMIEWETCATQNGFPYFTKYLNHKICEDQKQVQCVTQTTSNILLLRNDSGICNNPQNNSCKSSSAVICPTIDIHIGNIPANKLVYLTMDGVVDLKQFKNLKNQLSLTTVLSITMDHKSRFKFSKEQIYERSIATIIYPPRVQDTVTEVKTFFSIPFWAYILSILAGLLLLLIILLICRWAGFFESRYAQKKKDAQEDLRNMTELEPMNPPE
ncbi:integrin alpha-11-like isoform X2 [Styela clava]